jgi:uncharacterized protein (DUF433 family)
MTDNLCLPCQSCGWCHVLADPEEAAGDRCYRCGGTSFAVVTPAEVPRGVSLLARSHPDGDRDPGRLGGQWCIKGTRVPVQAIIDNAAEGCAAEEITTEIFDLPVDVVRRILRYARLSVL